MPTKSTTDIDRTVGVRIRTLRKSQGMTQTALGQAIGVSFQQLQKYEKGTNRLSASRLQDVAQVLGVPVSVLFGEAEGTDQGDALAILVAPGAVDLLKAYAAIEDEQLRHDVLAIVRTAARMGAGSLRERRSDWSRLRRPLPPPISA